MSIEQPRTGIILMNMGAPSDLDAIEGYLHRLFMDPLLIQLPAGFLYRRLLARFVARKRAAKVRSRYEQIGGGSPLLANTRNLAETVHDASGLPVEIAMRYSKPGAEEAVSALLAQGVERAIAVSLYPQFSVSTTASSVLDLQNAANGKLDLQFVDRHFDHPGFIQALSGLVTQGIASLDKTEDAWVLFTAHSVPLKYTAQGDPYIAEVERTREALVEALQLELPHTLAYQSAPPVGRWHGPDLGEVLPQLIERGIRRLVVCPLTFASDNLETLYDLDIVFARESTQQGIEQYTRVATPGTTEEYGRALWTMVKEKLSK